jgi:hypothetical protein
VVQAAKSGWPEEHDRCLDILEGMDDSSELKFLVHDKTRCQKVIEGKHHTRSIIEIFYDTEWNKPTRATRNRSRKHQGFRWLAAADKLKRGGNGILE